MQMNIHAKKIEMTDSIKNYIEDKIGKLDKYFENPDSITATINVSVIGEDQIIEVTINANKFIVRGEESDKDLYAAIDLVLDKMERQIRKNKTRMKHKVNKEIVTDFNLDYSEEAEEETTSIVKRKVIDTKPMDEEEAILQAELLGHPFFVFLNVDTNSISVIYKRKDGNYGIIDTK